ncbi:hypothetical protein TEA_014264 [Camellia sinensis var. sinensis]|uniref:Plastocyanin-like domain-containing protein n=1 Tax=Camellia sinensis var. sinensis TaxID=542762 RepID=A0A4S4D639_CAMSN|nr:hypothetical protein TEA_014264 [Camellia sinensis var. sinensis]
MSLDGNRIASSMNDISFPMPTTDILLAYYSALITTIGTKVRMFDYNETVEIVFQGTDVFSGAQNHPMHLHGHSFYVVGSGVGNFDNETDPKSYNLIDPPKLNTIRVPKKGWVTVRFIANNRGMFLIWNVAFIF